MKSEEYEGFSNFETFTFNVHLEHNRRESEEAISLAARCWRTAKADDLFSREEVAVSDMEATLRCVAENVTACDGPALKSALVNAALLRVDFREIACYWMSKAKEVMGDDWPA